MLLSSGESMELIAIASLLVVSGVISIISAYLIVQRTSKGFENDLLEYQNELSKTVQGSLKQIEKDLEPIITNNKRAFSAMSTIGSQVKLEKKAEKLLSEDILQNNEILLSAIESISPRLAGSLRQNPDQLIGMMPRLLAIADKMGLDLGSVSLSPSPRNPSTPHPFGFNEE
jgi:hypothetical protein